MTDQYRNPVAGVAVTFEDADHVGIGVVDPVRRTDAGGTATSEYTVVSSDGDVSDPVVPSPDSYLDIPLQRPAGGTTPPGVIHPQGEAYTYSAGDASVADLDGDGELEYLVKWDPSNGKDVSQVGYTGTVYLDAYKLDGELLWRLDLGVNIRAGAHYTQFLAQDFDGDGKDEIVQWGQSLIVVGKVAN